MSGQPGELHEAFIEDGGQPAEDVAARVIAFVDDAKRSLDVAIYDFEARSGASARIADALERASTRGVAVRVVFNAESCDHPADARSPHSPVATSETSHRLTRGLPKDD